jgi:hypothetical protein
MSTATVRVGVFPAGELRRRARLFAALEGAYPVRFEGRELGDWRELEGALVLGAAEVVPSAEVVPEVPEQLPSLSFSVEEVKRAVTGSIQCSDEPALARPLRGAALSDAHALPLAAVANVDPHAGSSTGAPADRHAAPSTVAPSGRAELVLASIDGLPAWVLDAGRAAPAYRIACAPAELGEVEALRERLEPGRCLALIGIVHFLRELTEERRWQAPPPRAAFLIDDPNLHWPSYGHIGYAELLRHAREHGYHLSVAMVPLDGWLAHPRVTRMFRAGAAQLSVCVHGNDHDGAELGRERAPADSHALAAQALRRADSFQRRTGVTVDRVMVAPHEQLTEQTARALVQRGFEAICVTRPYPWAVNPAQPPWLQRPAQAGPLVAWESSDVAAGGLPVLLRADFTHAREDLVLRAFLGQPLILYSHHDLFEHGLDRLADAAAFINGLGETRWGSLGEIARTSAQTRRRRGSLELRMLTPRAELAIPAGVHELRVDAGALCPVDGTRLIVERDDRTAIGGSSETALGGTPAGSGIPIPVSEGDRVELRLAAPACPPAPAPPRRLRPILRRLATEGRDRARAVTRS